MAPFARGASISRRSWLLAGLATPLVRAWSAEKLAVNWDGDNLHVAAPGLHFLTGKPMERLRDGATVAFFSQLTLFTDNRVSVFRRITDRLLVSYDLWEEKFSVSRLLSADRPVSHLTAAAAEAWFVEGLAISAMGLVPDGPFWLRLELRTADPRELSSVLGEPGISITRLIEVFSRKPGGDEPNWTLDRGPLRLAELPRAPVRGTRSG